MSCARSRDDPLVEPDRDRSSPHRSDTGSEGNHASLVISARSRCGPHVCTVGTATPPRRPAYSRTKLSSRRVALTTTAAQNGGRCCLLATFDGDSFCTEPSRLGPYRNHPSGQQQLQCELAHAPSPGEWLMACCRGGQTGAKRDRSTIDGGHEAIRKPCGPEFWLLTSPTRRAMDGPAGIHTPAGDTSWPSELRMSRRCNGSIRTSLLMRSW